MTNKEIIEQLESLEANQRDFIAHDETGIFERDVEALEKAVDIIKSMEEVKTMIKERIRRTDNVIDIMIDNKDEEEQVLKYMYQNNEAKTILYYIDLIERGELNEDDY